MARPRPSTALVAVLVSLLLPTGALAATSAGKSEKSLQKTLSSDLKAADGTSSALVIDETTGQTLYSAAPGTGRLPASVEKLYTTTTALMKFGADARLRTGVYGVGTLGPKGVWKGNLYLRGGGDPTFGSAAFDQDMYGQGATVQALAANLRRAGIRSVDGRIIGDESYFDSLRGTPATGYAPNFYVEGQLSALAYDGGWTSESEDAFQPRPALYATQAFVSALHAAGIDVPAKTPIYTGVTPAGAKLLAYVNSPTMAALIRLTNTPSDNFFAETLLKDIGARFGGGGTTADGAAVVRSFIAQQFDVHPTLDDGSGLSRSDFTTAAQVVSLLRQMQADSSFMDSLAVAGVSGTMQDEMLGTRAVDNCRGKTGTLYDVANLVGFCTAKNGNQLVFAFLMNGLSDSDYGHELEDDMGVALANYNAPPVAPSSPPSSSPPPAGNGGSGA